MRNIREYDVFKLAHKLVLKIYKLTKSFPKEETFNLTSQIRRSAYSIPMNLVEGGARKSPKEFAHYIDIAVGSCEEVRYQLLLSKDLGYISPIEHGELDRQYEDVKNDAYKIVRKSKIAVSGWRYAVSGDTLMNKGLVMEMWNDECGIRNRKRKLGGNYEKRRFNRKD
jgi:four helix bundle protein